METQKAILAVNAGSSSVKIALYALPKAGGEASVLLSGQVSGIGTSASADGDLAAAFGHFPGDAPGEHDAVLSWLLEGVADWCARQGRELCACGHRVVHGGERLRQSCLVTEEVEAEIERISPLARSHNPHNLAAIRKAGEIFFGVPQVACFDTAFHATQPELATVMALPEEVRALGVRRYGFHGLSYHSVRDRLAAMPGGIPARTIIAHLGNGASLCALADGLSVATTMGFTPLDGLIMGTRPGLTDPGVIPFLLRETALELDAIEAMLSRESGLKGLSGISGDMRELEASSDSRAQFALSAYAYRVGREAGSLVAALGGLDAFVFTGGVGENSIAMRERIASQLAWLGARIDDEANAAPLGKAVRELSAAGSTVRLLAVRTAEEEIILHETKRIAGLGG